MTGIPAQRTATTRSVPAPRRTTVAAEGPASLTQVRRRATACPECGSSRVTALAMTLTDGTPVQFASCHECEHRSWSHDGATLEFADVISKATKIKA